MKRRLWKPAIAIIITMIPYAIPTRAATTNGAGTNETAALAPRKAGKAAGDPRSFAVRAASTYLAQTLELRNSPVPAKVVDDSGINLRDDPLATPKPVLTGVLTKEELIGRAIINDDGKSVTLYVVNQGKRALMFNGDQAIILSGAAKQNTKDQYEIIPPPKKTDVPSDIKGFIISGATNGAGPTIYDMATSIQPDGVPFYGKDQDRRRLAERRFGQRTLFPGETTQGIVYLPDDNNACGQVSIPVNLHPSGESIGNFVVNIQGRPAQASSGTPK